MRKILHVDMDQFFAAVEQRDHPELAGKPVAVGHDAARGVVATASYEARRYGVHSAQSVVTARRLCPQLIVVEPRFLAYKEVSAQVRQVFEEFTDLIEPLSLDEAFLDVTANKQGLALGIDCARAIKERIRQATGLTASAGVSYCKFLAKIASDYRKPDGLCVIHPDRALQFIDRLPVGSIWGVGEKTAQHMHRMGIFTGADLRRASLEQLQHEFGKMGRMFYDFARGIDERPVVTQWERKSVSCEQTFEHDIWKPAQLSIELYHLVLQLEERLKKSGFEGRTLTLKAKFSDFRQVTRSTTQQQVLTTKDAILPLSRMLLGQVGCSSERPLRLLGLGVSGTAHADDHPAPEVRPQWKELELEFLPW